MPTALEGLSLRLDSIEESAAFSRDAAMLRPRLRQFVAWPPGDEHASLRELMTAFLDAKSVRIEILYGALFVRAIGCFEGFLRQLLKEGVQRAVAGRTYDDVSEGLGKHNIRLTGRALASIFEPTDYLRFDFQQLIDNLATCRPGNATFQLNVEAFAATVVGTSPAALTRAFKHIQIELDSWDKIATHAPLKRLLGTTKVRETAKASEARLNEYSRLRNVLAHGGEGADGVSETELFESIEFFRALAGALCAVVLK